MCQTQQPPLHLLPTSSREMPPLTSDLLHVEQCLQSKVKILEGEKKEAYQNILQLENAILEQKKNFSKEKESLLEENRSVIGKVKFVAMQLNFYDKRKNSDCKGITINISFGGFMYSWNLSTRFFVQNAGHTQRLRKNR